MAKCKACGAVIRCDLSLGVREENHVGRII